MHTPAALDQLQQLQELNRAFLGLLQSRVRQQCSCLGLPAAVRAAVASASGALLDGVACFPRALFRAELGPRPRLQRDERNADFDEAEHDLCLSILFAARHTSRHSPFQARLLFNLSVGEVERLCAAPLTDLQQLACVPGVLHCAFREPHWFWEGLFTATRPELRRQLTLMALQPSALRWPQRRPPQASV